mgnify:CR=1 FL=1
MSKLIVLAMSLLLVACGQNNSVFGSALTGEFANSEHASNYTVSKSSDGEYVVSGTFLEMKFDSVSFKPAPDDEIDNLIGTGASNYVELIVPDDMSIPIAHGWIDLEKVSKDSELLKQFEPFSNTWDGYFMFAVFGVIPVYTK